METDKAVKIKRLVKSSLGKMLGAGNRQVKWAIARAEVVSFDIFDTLVKRTVKYPEDIHILVQKKFSGQMGVEVDDYQKRRMDAEAVARKNSRKEEVSLSEIFSYMDGVKETHREFLKKIEETTEIENCLFNQRMKAVYENALRDGRRIIITSDMYLDEKVIKKILYKCGYNDYEKLYLSSALGLCKSTGSIFEIIKEDYAGASERILHMGDNVKSDFVIPKLKGLDALLINGK